MTQQTSPFLEAAYGWAFGESGWNGGMDENLLKFSYMFDKNIDSIVASLPPAVSGQAHFLTTDNRIYYAVGSNFHSTPVPKWTVLTERSTGKAWQYNGTSLVEISNESDLDGFKSDLQSISGSSLVGWQRTALEDTVVTVQDSLDTTPASPWEYADLVTVRPTPSDPATWDWTLALNTLFSENRNVFLDPGDYRITASVFIPSNTTVRGTRSSKIFMTENPDGHNLVCVKDSENVTIQGFSIVGIDGAGTSFPTPGVVDGQGVCFIAYGSKNVSVLDMYSAHNGRGSGNFYFATTNHSRMIGNYVELSSNAFCIDNYYDAPPEAPCPSHSSNVIISGNTSRDVGGNGIAIDCADSPEKNNNFAIVGNTVEAAAYSGIHINAFGVLVAGNVISGRRDQGRTVMGGQQSLPTYFGFLSTIGGQFIKVIDNQFLEIYQAGIRVSRNEHFEAANNTILMATSYANQNNGGAVQNIADDAASADYSPIRVLADVDTPRGLGKVRINNNTVVSYRDHGSLVKAPNLIGIFNNTGNSVFVGATEVVVNNNDLTSVPDSNYAIQYFQTSALRSSRISVDGNQFNPTQSYSRGISVGIINTALISNNTMSGLAIGAEVTRAVNIAFVGNTWISNAIGISIAVANTAAQIDNLSFADTFIGTTTWCFSAPQANGSAVTNSDASRCNFVNCPLSVIKNASYPRNLRGPASSTSPTVGFWEVRDVVPFSSPTSFKEMLCTVAGTPGTWQSTGAIYLTGSSTYDPPSLVDGAGATTTVTVTGAALGDFVETVSFSLDLQGITVTAYVSAANTVSVRFQNESGATVDLASGTIRVRLSKA